MCLRADAHSPIMRFKSIFQIILASQATSNNQQPTKQLLLRISLLFNRFARTHVAHTSFASATAKTTVTRTTLRKAGVIA